MGAQENSGSGRVEQTVAAARELASWFDVQYARPAAAIAHRAWLTRPVSTTFLGILIALSAVPVILFLIFCIAVSTTLIVTGLTVAVVSAGVIILLAGSALVCLLIFLSFVAAGLTGLFLALLGSYRLVASLRANNAHEGASGRVQETQRRDISPQFTTNGYKDTKDRQES